MANLKSEVSTSRVAIVGDGVGALIVLAVLVHAGMPSDEITIYGDSPHPLGNLQRYAIALGQKRMRSESNGHLAPIDFPGMAWRDAYQHRSPGPLVASLFDRYNPPIELLVAQADALMNRVGFHQRKVSAYISQIQRVEKPEPLFLLLGEDGDLVGKASHVILALGHAGLAWPDAMRPWRSHPGVVHAYDGPAFQVGDRVAVVGSGMAAAHLWSLALAKGAQVTALHRRPLRCQQLNAPRSAFSAVGIDAYRRLCPAERLATLRQMGHGSFPWRLSWQRQWRRTRLRGQFRSIQGELVAMEPVAPGTEDALSLHVDNGETIEVDKLVCATGFITSALSYPLIAQMVATHDLPTIGGHLAVSDDFTLTSLSQGNSICGVLGALARWALPVADTFAGIKYAARRLAPQLLS